MYPFSNTSNEVTSVIGDSGFLTEFRCRVTKKTSNKVKRLKVLPCLPTVGHCKIQLGVWGHCKPPPPPPAGLTQSAGGVRGAKLP